MKVFYIVLYFVWLVAFLFRGFSFIMGHDTYEGIWMLFDMGMACYCQWQLDRLED